MRELTYSCSIITSDGIKDFSELDTEQKAKINENWSKRLSDVMSGYYTQHPTEIS